MIAQPCTVFSSNLTGTMITPNQPDTPNTYREFSVAAVLLGFIQGVILNVAFVYIALKLGFSIGGSTIAAILGYVFLRGVLRTGTAVENNLNQTIASGINSAGTGVVFVLPAVFLLGLDQMPEFSLWPLVIAGISGALLGVVLIIPLRKQLIELQRLRFPTGVAVASIISSGYAGADKAKLLGIGFIIAAVWKIILVLGWCEIPGLIEHEELNLSFGILPAYMAPALYLSLLNFAAGLLSGRAGLPFFIGGILAWWVISPTSVALGWTPDLPDVELTLYIFEKMLSPLGIGILIGAAFMEVIVAYPAIKSALRALSDAAHIAHAQGSSKGLREEMPLQVLVIGGILAVILFFFAAWLTPGVSLPQALMAALLGVLWMGLAGLIVAQATGLTDISPISGMALISVSLMLFLLDGNILAAILITIGVAVAIGQSSDMMQDLKTGFIVGSRPFLQQMAQFASTWIGVLVAFGVIYLLWYGAADGTAGFGPGTDLPAPQAVALSGIIESMQSDTIATDKFLLGGIIGAVLTASPFSGVGVLVGLAMYLPFSVTLGYGLGCLTNMWIVRRRGASYAENTLVPLAAGLIIGEAIIGVGHAIYTIVSLG